MQYGKFSLSLLAFLLIFTACGKKDKTPRPEDFIRPAAMNYTQKDSSDIHYLVDNYIKMITANDIQGAAKMLYTVKNDSVHPLTDVEARKFIDTFTTLHIYAVKKENLILRDRKNNEFNILLQIVKSGDVNTGKGTTTQALNPVLINGKWYLTLRDKYAEGVKDVYKDANVSEK